MDDIDRRILNRIQSDFPIAERPFEAIAVELGFTEHDVLDRVKKLKAAGIIRRIGGNFVPGKLGFVSTLCAARVPSDRIDHFTRIVNGYPGVTHNYRRDNPYNVWFTFIAPSMAEIKANIEAIERKTGITSILNLPATNIFKIRAKFDLKPSDPSPV
ncbi:MAG: AsnC family transcriptional regulator [Desulfobacterales bacterium]|nr:AsnC family transcriptional regulator [Desulfobacterales bacterium]